MNTENLNLFLQPLESAPVIPIENKRLLTASKADLSLFASEMIEAVDDGKADALNTVIMAKKMKYVAEGVIEGMKGKASIPSEKDFSKHHVNIREQTTGTKYYFEGCNDHQWNELTMDLLVLQEKIAARETWLKTVTKPVLVEESTNEETGEVIPAHTVNPPVKTGAQSLVYTLK